jgi:hypothetical protein
MGDNGIIGLIMQVGADTAGAEEAIQAFAQRTGQSVGMVEAQIRDYQRAEGAAYDEAVQRTRGAADEMERGLLNSHQSVHLLAEEMGIHLPRAVTSAVGEMLPEIASLGGALVGVFAAKEIYEFGQKIADAAREASGMTEAAHLMAEAVKENNTAIEDYAKTGSKAARQELAEMNRRIANWTVALEARREYFANEGPIAYAMQFYLGEVGKTEEGEKKLAAMEQLRDAILKILTEDTVKEGEASARVAKEKQEAWERSTEEEYQYFAARRRHAEQEFEDYVRLGEEIMRLYDRNRELREEVALHLQLSAAEMRRKSELSIQEEMYRALDVRVKMLLAHSRELRAEWNLMHPTAARMREEMQLLGIDTQNLSARQLEFVGAEEQVVGALDKELMAYGFKAKAMKGFLAEELRELASFLTKKAHFKAIEQVAEALGSWPNGVAMAEHFAAAAAWEALGAGISGLAGAGAGALNAGGRAERSGYGTRDAGRGSNTGGGIPDSATLAPGAGGNRFSSPGAGVVIIRGTQEFENIVAGAVNSAVSRGVNVTATSAQRGSPVGH